MITTSPGQVNALNYVWDTGLLEWVVQTSTGGGGGGTVDQGTGGVSAWLITGTVTTNPTLPSTATVSNIAASASNVTLKISNAARRGLSVYNDSSSVLYVKFGTTASTSSYTIQMAANSYYELPQPCYTGIVDGIWASATGNARITEVS